MQSAVFLILCLPAIFGHTLSRTHVYVYNGYGADELHVERMLSHLQAVLSDSYTVSSIGAEDVKRGAWANDAALFMMPGGFDLGFISSLGDEGARKIRQYVTGGGAYLGQGAGSYYACDRIEFDLNGLDEVTGNRPLKFYPGLCTGPVLAPYNYYDYSGARAAQINFRFVSPNGDEGRSINLKAYYNGGNTFDSATIASENTTCVTLGFFVEDGNPPAIVKCNTYAGKAVLTGVHLEFGSTHLNSGNQHLAAVQQGIQPHDDTRIDVYRSILQHLGLTTRSDLSVELHQ